MDALFARPLPADVLVSRPLASPAACERDRSTSQVVAAFSDLSFCVRNLSAAEEPGVVGSGCCGAAETGGSLAERPLH